MIIHFYPNKWKSSEYNIQLITDLQCVVEVYIHLFFYKESFVKSDTQLILLLKIIFSSIKFIKGHLSTDIILLAIKEVFHLHIIYKYNTIFMENKK